MDIYFPWFTMYKKIRSFSYLHFFYPFNENLKVPGVTSNHHLAWIPGSGNSSGAHCYSWILLWRYLIHFPLCSAQQFSVLWPWQYPAVLNSFWKQHHSLLRMEVETNSKPAPLQKGNPLTKAFIFPVRFTGLAHLSLI